MNHSLLIFSNLYVEGGPGRTSPFIVLCIAGRMLEKLLADGLN
jgi:hypothetical protein